MTTEAPTYGPFHLLVMGVCPPRQFTAHLVEAFDCVSHEIGRFEMVAESTVNGEPWGCNLQTNKISSQREEPGQKETLTLRAASKASLHEPPVNFDLAHSLKSGVGDGEWRVASTPLSGVLRHRCKKSVWKCRMHSGGTGQHDLPATQVTMDPVM